MSLACELLAWAQMLTLTGAARRWEPKRQAGLNEGGVLAKAYLCLMGPD